MNQFKDKYHESALKYSGSWSERTAVLLSKTFGNMKFFCLVPAGAPGLDNLQPTPVFGTKALTRIPLLC